MTTKYIIKNERPKTDTVVILALGESTTTGIYPNQLDEQWPQLLEKSLVTKYPQTSFEVINAGIAGANTQHIAENFLILFHKYNPDLVISMLGVNDIDFLLRRKYSLQIFKLFDIIKSNYLSNYYATSECPNNGVPPGDISKQIFQDARLLAPKQALAYFEKATADYLQKFPAKKTEANFAVGVAELFFIESTAKTCGESCRTSMQEIVNDGMNRFAGTLSKCPNNVWSLGYYMYLSTGYGSQKEGAEKFEDFVEKMGAPSPYFLNITAKMVSENKDLKNRLAALNLSLQNVNAFNFSKKNLIEIENLLLQELVPFVVMSYPTVSMDAFKNIFSDEPVYFKMFRDSFYFTFKTPPKPSEKYKNLYFVTNENFKAVLNENTFDKYFSDRFCSRWDCKFGHARLLGNQKIVENILNQQGALFEKTISKKNATH